MTNTTSNEAALSETTDPVSSIAEYLGKHREFFVEHPELLTDLVIPHASGKAVSLVEKQVEVLREENRQLKARFRELVGIARDNEELARRMHRLTLRLVEAETPDQIFAALYDALRADFAADAVVLRIFARAAYAGGETRSEFSGKASSLREMYAEALETRRPSCGRLKRSQQEALFGAEGETVGSAAMLPLIGKHWDGILVVGSHDPRRYHPEMGIDLLAHLGDIASLIIHPWVAAANL